MPATTSRLAVALLGLTLAGCAVTRPGPDGQPTDIELQKYVAALRKVVVTIDGMDYDFLFDTGGGYTLIGPDVAAAVGCKPHGKLTGFRMDGERLDTSKCGPLGLSIGRASLQTEVGYLDINALLPDGLPPLHGVLSLDAFRDHAITLDLAANRLRLETATSLAERSADMAPLAVSFYNEIEGRGLSVYVEARSSRGDVHLLLDSGNLAGNLVDPLAWQELTGDESPPAVGQAAEIAVDLGPAGTHSLPFEAKPLIREGALDVRFIESGVFTFDFPNRRAWVQFRD